MIAELVQAVAAVQPALVVLSSSSGDSGSGELFILLAGPACGLAFFWGVWQYYRNTDKSHDFEHETTIEPTGPVTGTDTKVGEKNGQRDSSISGDNHRRHRARVRRVA